ncbi:MAG TPA: nucleoside triphosphate pyrophosphohydrolase [Candidatus Humimicrobiaceae bacterium]|nr:nucleoside triphosphate pyrophosphohydrolase [Candidatus Humimicrobiaceae bacterium]
MKSQLNNRDLENIDKINDSGKLFAILVEIMKKLRSPDGCMWDREQNHKTIKRNLIEETYEAVESIENNSYTGLKEELGDLLLQIIFHSQIAAESEEFSVNEVLQGIIKKLIRRHPHVFQGVVLNSSDEILANWEDIKKKERKEKFKKPDSIFGGIPKSLPSLHYASEIQNRASRLGFDWKEATDIFDKIKEELAELKKEVEEGKESQIPEEIGDVLFSIVNFSRRFNIDCEESLYEASKKFIRRYNFMEKYAEENNLNFKKLPLKEKDKLWKIAKRELS